MTIADRSRKTELPALAGQGARERPGPVRYYARSLWRNKVALAGIIVIVTIIVCAVGAPWIAPRDPAAQNLASRLAPPVWQEGGSWDHPLGADQLGRDVLSRIIYGSRVSLLVGATAVLIQGTLGIALGLIAGYRGGSVDSILMRITDIQHALPFLLLAIAIMAVIGASLRNVIIVLGITGWVYYARIVRAEVLAMKNREFVEAAITIGAGSLRVMLRHIFPNLFASAIVVATLQLASMIIQEASLSFLGLGVPPHIPSWGVMVAQGRGYVATGWWVAAFSGGSIFLLVVAVNVVGDWLRDELDPTMRGR